MVSRIACAVLLASLPASVASAQVATCGFTADASPLIGETFGGRVTIDNSGGALGFVPAVELMLPAGVTLQSASFRGSAVAPQVVGTFGAGGTLTNPLTLETVAGPVGSSFVFLRLPLSSLAPSTPAIGLDLTFDLATTAALGTPLDLQGTCLFAFGADALNNPGADAPRRSDAPGVGNDQTVASVTPSVLRVTKTAPPPTPSGPSYPVAFDIGLDVAAGATVSNLNLTDVVDGRFQITAITVTPPTAGIVNAPVLPTVTPGGTVDIDFGPLTGVAGGDVTVSVQGFVPQLAAGGAPVLDPLTGASITIPNTALVSGGSYAGPGGTVPVPGANAQANFQVLSKRVRETITNQSRPGQAFRPTDVAALSIETCVSDFFTMNSVALTSVIGDGTTYVAASGSPVPVVTGADPTTLTFTLGTVSPGATNCQTATFTADVDETYVGGASVLTNDVIPTSHRADGLVAGSGQPCTADEVQSGTDASIAIEGPALSKVVAAINGVPATAPFNLTAGDVVTFQLTAQIPSGDLSAAVLIDYLPGPIFDAVEHGVTPVFGAGNPLRFGPSHTAGVTLATVGASAADNAVTFTFNPFTTLPSSAVTVDVLLDYTVSSAPFEDGLVFTNLLASSISGSATTVADLAIQEVTLQEPDLFITLGALSTDSQDPNATFTPAPVASPYSSTQIATTPMISDLAEVDAGDRITFVVLVENRGSEQAFDIDLQDVLPPELTVVTPPVVRLGDGSAVAGVTGDLFAGTFRVPSLAAFDPASGTNILAIEYTVQVGNAVRAQLQLSNQVTVTNYASQPGGANFVPAFPDPTRYTDAATVDIDNFEVTKAVTGATSGTIQDTTTYRITVVVPEGRHDAVVISDTLPAALALTAAPTVVVNGFAAAPVVNVTNSGRSFTVNLGNVDNTASLEASSETVTIDAPVIVLNNGSANAGTSVSNTASLDFTGGATVQGTSPTFDIVEPALTTTLGVAPNPVDDGDTVTFTADLSHPGGSSADAHDVVYVVTLPPGLVGLGGFASTGGLTPTSISVVANTVSVTYATFANGSISQFQFTANVATGTALGTSLPVSPTVTWTSQPGVVGGGASQSPFTADAVERDGSGTPAVNDYTTGVTTNVDVRPLSVGQVLQPGGANRTGVVGDLFTFRVQLAVPEGSSAATTVTESLPAGLVFVGASNFTASAPLTCTVGACTAPTQTVSPDGRTAQWDFGTVTNTAVNNGLDESIAFDIQGRIANVAAAQSGVVLTAALDVNGNAGTTTGLITVLEPDLGITLSLAPSPVDAGDVVTATLDFVHTPASTAAAQDLVATIPALGDLSNPTTFNAGTCAGATAVLAAESAVVSVPSLALGASCRATFTVVVDDTATFGATLNVPGALTWTSQPGVSAVERDGSGGVNDYVAPFSGSVAVSGAAALAHAFVSADQAVTVDPDLAPGELGTYDVQVTLPEGTSNNVSVLVTPPVGFALESVQRVLPGGTAITTSVDPTNAALAGTAGQPFTFSLGRVVNPGDNVATNDAVVLRLVGRAVYDAALRTNPSRTQTAELSVGGAVQANAPAPVLFVLPVPRVSLTVDDPNPAENGAVVLTATMNNLGTGPVCDTQIDLDVPAGLTLDDPATDGIDNDGNTIFDGADPNEATLRLNASRGRLVITGCVPAATARSLVLRATVAAAIPNTPIVAQATLGTYRPLPGAGPTFDPLADDVDNNGQGGADEPTDAVAPLTITPVAPVLVFTKAAVDVNGALVEPGETLRYDIVIDNSAGTASARGVQVQDILPAVNAAFTAGSETTTQGTVSVAAGVLTADVGDVAAGATVTVSFQVVVAAPLAAGQTVQNQASLSTTDGYGGLVSDDPATAAPDDITVSVSASTNDLDGDGVPNANDSDPLDPFVCSDIDGDSPPSGPSCDDCASGVFDPSADGPDADGDGLCDAGETFAGTDPNDADSDDDGVVDGAEPGGLTDTDGDGLVDALDPDSDNDGVLDGTELGVTTATTGTDVTQGHFVPDADPATTTDPRNPDSDAGGASDGAEDPNGDGQVDATETDPNVPGDDVTVVDTDNDGLSDAQEILLGSDPLDADTDDDGVLDGAEPNPSLDTDGDGLINVLDPDSDGDRLFDGTESGVTVAHPDTDVAAGHFVPDADPATTTSPLLADTDRGGLADGGEDLNLDGRRDAGETDPNDPADDATPPLDTDGDGIPDAQELLLGSDPNDRDTDDDGVLDGAEIDPASDVDGDGLPALLDPDSDDDGIFDGTELGVTVPDVDTDVTRGVFVPDADPSTTTQPANPDTDGGGARDGAEDVNANGRIDAGERDPNLASDDATVVDSDGDGLSDAQEVLLGSDPNDADTDDDGVLDGAEPNPGQDADGDGRINLLDPDSDGDGLFDGTETGVTTPDVDTDVSRGVFVPDADPSTTTSPVSADTDRGGVPDGAEDTNLDGAVDVGELDPNDPADDVTPPLDTDGDGLTDAQEALLGTDPNDADTDDDGVLDGAEADLAADSDGDGLINPLDPDSDDDGIFDGTESGVTTPDADTDVTRGVFVPDADPTTTTSPVSADTDRGGVPDGAEDTNGNGRVDAGELDPNDPADDAVPPTDTDGDGIPDAQEVLLGTDPNDADSDDDGVLDGAEPNYAADTDGDGLINALDPDSDDDGLFDGTELGVTTPDTDTDVAAGVFVADADPSTTTSALRPDSDRGGVPDGAEDTNRNGRVDAGELDPNDPADDVTPPTDTDNDGIPDAQELLLGTDPNDADTDDDGVLDGAESNPTADTDRDGRINALDPDSDDDGLFDGTERSVTVAHPDTDVTRGVFVPDADPLTSTNPLLADTDGGGITDGAEDFDGDGQIDLGETDPNDPVDDTTIVDTDGDGLSDPQELALGTDPNDADTDDDGVIDGAEVNPSADSDGDGLINALDPDSDDDGLFDGTEQGITVPDVDTATAAGVFVPDADPTTGTSPVDPDTDRGGVPDGVEDANRNGAIDAGETDPNLASDDGVLVDRDGDGLADILEISLGSDPTDPDTDDDGVLDGDEPNPAQDADGDGRINVLDPDSDDDGLFDGTELGITVATSTGTDVSRGVFVPDADPTTQTHPLLADTDRGGVPDGAEDTNLDGAVDVGELDPNDPADDVTPPTDTDGDGIPDAQETLLGTDPNDRDTDDDGVIDGDEPDFASDTDGDGLINVLDPDSDDDGLYDGTEVGITTPDVDTDVSRGVFVADADPSTTTGALTVDTDRGGVPDGVEDTNGNGRVDAGELDPNDPADDATPPLDTDGDGLSDAQEALIGSDPNDADTDDDGVLDGDEANFRDDTDGDGLINVLDPDSDDDGIFDGTEAGVTTPDVDTDVSRGVFVPDADPTTRTGVLNPDTDAGGVSDGAEDANRNGRVDANETDPNDPADDAGVVDSDGDGLSDAQEAFLGTDPNDADSDDDGVRDGDEPNLAADTDGDGLINALDPDSDDDGLFDGTELGVTTPDPDTDVGRGVFVPDADPTTTTSAIDPDSDGGGVPDGIEDLNLDGAVDAGETDPNDPADDAAPLDMDGDGIPDAQEVLLGTDPLDADTDDDGVLDGDEPNYAADTDGDGLINALDPDSDDDGIFDGTELGVTTPNSDTDVAAGVFVPDADPSTTTSALRADSDGGGVSDGAEDPNPNGRIDPGELDPNDPTDDATPPTDTDGDGLSDAQEALLGTDPNDADTDDDGVLDGEEPNPRQDVDGDGRIGPLDPDSDDDGLFDGTERGVTTAHPDTDVSAGVFVADADPTTTTSALAADTDRGGIPDGDEDLNGNGRLDPSEGDPLDPADDGAGIDTDGDGLSDGFERSLGSDPNDPDTDDDGVIDGAEFNPRQDADGDGLPNVLDPDSDDDGIFDGTEAGIVAPSTGTDVSAGHFIPDADPSTTTNPVARDTDGGGLFDGAEDTNRNGAIDPGEGDPLDPADDTRPIVDTDQDGLPDALEIAIGTDPLDADTDDDGVLDGAEPTFAGDVDGDGRISALDPDSDDDGLFDGTEVGVTTRHPHTNPTVGVFVPDADPTTTTSALRRDTDGGGVSDGSEDFDGNGRVDGGEGDPLDPADDAGIVDTDGDGLSDGREGVLGTDPLDADTDDDGVLDGLETDLTVDTDGDGVINVLDPDSDGDGIFDGTEAGVTEAHPDTDVSVGVFVPDADPTTTTSPVLRDTDRGGLGDGFEDRNADGAVDAGETDPLDPSDDNLSVDSDMDGILDVVEGLLDPDGDGIPNFLDLDSDGDGILDSEEAGDADLATPPVDTDGDGVPDFLDLDSDDDSIPDSVEAGDTDLDTPPIDTDGDGKPDYIDIDSDGDSIPDVVEAGDTDPATAPVDTDGDGTPDYIDVDSDNDSISDEAEAGDGSIATLPVDTDGDGIPDVLDNDSDDDGLSDDVEAGDTELSTPPVDTDGDGAPDFQDVDSDNDGVEDADDNCVRVANPDQADEDGDGVGDVCEGDNDGDGIDDPADNCPEISNPDQADLDGDGLGDVCDPDGNGDGIDDNVRVAGGGCTHTRPDPDGDPPWAWLLILLPLIRRRR